MQVGQPRAKLGGQRAGQVVGRNIDADHDATCGVGVGAAPESRVAPVELPWESRASCAARRLARIISRVTQRRATGCLRGVLLLLPVARDCPCTFGCGLLLPGRNRRGVAGTALLGTTRARNDVEEWRRVGTAGDASPTVDAWLA